MWHRFNDISGRRPFTLAWLALCALLLAACGGGGGGVPATPGLTLAASALETSEGGAALSITASRTALSGTMSWSLAAGAPGRLDGNGDSAVYTPPAPGTIAADSSVTVTASVGNTAQSLQLSVRRTRLVQAFVGTPTLDANGRDSVFDEPRDIVADAAGNLFIADQGRGVILKVTPQGVVSTYAGQPYVFGMDDGAAASASFNRPSALALDAAGNLYVADMRLDEASAPLIRKVSAQGQVSTLLRAASWTRRVPQGIDGPSGVATFAENNIVSLAVDAAGTLYAGTRISVRKISAAGAVSTFAGGCPLAGEHDGDLFCRYLAVDGQGLNANFATLSKMRFGPDGTLYVIDGYAVRKISPTAQVSTLAGAATAAGNVDGAGAAARFGYNSGGLDWSVVFPRIYFAPNDLALDAAGNVYVVDGANDTIRKIAPDGQVETQARRIGLSGPVTSLDADLRAGGIFGAVLTAPDRLVLLSRTALQTFKPR